MDAAARFLSFWLFLRGMFSTPRTQVVVCFCNQQLIMWQKQRCEIWRLCWESYLRTTARLRFRGKKPPSTFFGIE
jgi:hypothetical protein